MYTDTLPVDQEKYNMLIGVSGEDSWPGIFWRMGRLVTWNVSTRFFTVGTIVSQNSIIPKYGTHAVQAGVFISIWSSAIISTFRTAAQTSTTNLFSEKLGEDHAVEHVNEALYHAHFLWGGVMLLPIWSIMACVQFMLAAAGAEHQVINMTQAYFYPYMASVPFIMWLNCDLSFFLSIEKPKFNVVWSAIGASTQIGLSFWLSYWKNHGFMGLGIATSLGYFMGVACEKTYLYSNNELVKRYHLWQWPAWDRLMVHCQTLLKIGGWAGLQMLFEWGNMLIIGMVLADRGERVLTALHVSIALMSYYSLVLVGISSMASVLIKKRYAAWLSHMTNHFVSELQHEKIIIGRLAVCNAVMCVASALLPAVVAFGMTDVFIDVTTSGVLEESTRTLAKHMLYTNAVCQFVDALGMSLDSSLRGIHDLAFAPRLHFILVTVVGIPLGLYWAAQEGWDENAIFIARTVMLSLSTLAKGARFVYKLSQLGESNSPATSPVNRQDAVAPSRWCDWWPSAEKNPDEEGIEQALLGSSVYSANLP
jgi:Na+-driven multidrug efflux pump